MQMSILHGLPHARRCKCKHFVFALLAAGRALSASGSLAMTTLRQSWLRGPRCQRWWGVTQKTQEMMLNRTVTGSLVVMHKEARGPWAETYSAVCSRARDWCHKWGGRGSQRVAASTLLTGGCESGMSQCPQSLCVPFPWIPWVLPGPRSAPTPNTDTSPSPSCRSPSTETYPGRRSIMICSSK